MKNYYQILGLEKDASKEEIKKAFRLYATKFHPDKQSGDKFFEERFKEIHEAYEVLSDENKRNHYDLLFNRVPKTINNTNDNQYNKENELLRKEEELSRKEAELNIKKEHIEKSDRIKKEYELSKIVNFKDNHIIISGVNIQIDNEIHSFDDFYNIKAIKERRQRTNDSEKGKTIYGLISLSFIIGIFTSGAIIGVFIIIIGFLLLIYVLFSKIFKTIFVLFQDLIWPKYKLILISKSDNIRVLESYKYKILKIEKIMSIALEKYYAPAGPDL